MGAVNPNLLRVLNWDQIRVARLIARGLAGREIARRLGLSYESFRGHRARIYRRVGVSSRADLALWGLEHGLVSEDEVLERAVGRADV